MRQDEKSKSHFNAWMLILSIGIPAAVCGAAFNSFIFHYPDTLGWISAIDAFLYRYQTALTGAGAIFLAWLSVRKVADQIDLQREQHVSNKRFTLQNKINALIECHDVLEQVTFEVGGPGEILSHSSNMSTLQYFADEALLNFREDLPTNVRRTLEKLTTDLKNYNSLSLTEAYSRDRLLEEINNGFGALHALTLDAEHEINRLLK